MPPADRPVSEITFHVRYAETDAMGVVHHAVYLVWFEEGRSAYIRERGASYAQIEAAGYFLAAGELQARYLRAARYDQRVRTQVWIDEVKSRALTFGCEVVDAGAGEPLFRASLRLICLDATGAVCRIPRQWDAWLRP